LTDFWGNVIERYEYDAYGNPTIWNADFTTERANSNYGNPYLFTGRRTDILDSGSLKIQYNRNRYYDYYTGRWLTHDPLGIVPNSLASNFFMPVQQYSQGLSLYQYVSSNPEMGIDPWGLLVAPEPEPEEDICNWPHSNAYKIGTDGPAYVHWEHGRFNAADPRDIPYMEDYLLHIFVRAYLTARGGRIRLGGRLTSGTWETLPDASKHLLHYLSKSGTRIDTDLTRLIRDIYSAKVQFISDVDNAMAEAERILDEHSYSEPVNIVQEGYSENRLRKEDSANWYFALGSYHTWGKGTNVRKGKGRKNCCYYMNWSYNLRDNYEFENKLSLAGLVWDYEMWLLNTYGWARHFRIRAVKGLSLTWIRGYRFYHSPSVGDAANMLNMGAQPPFPQCQ
jgi:RHS repeat-associated protein